MHTNQSRFGLDKLGKYLSPHIELDSAASGKFGTSGGSNVWNGTQATNCDSWRLKRAHNRSRPPRRPRCRISIASQRRIPPVRNGLHFVVCATFQPCSNPSRLSHRSRTSHAAAPVGAPSTTALRSNRRRARCTLTAPYPAISCLGASRTPPVGACGWTCHPGVRETCIDADLAVRVLNLEDGSPEPTQPGISLTQIEHRYDLYARIGKGRQTTPASIRI